MFSNGRIDYEPPPGGTTYGTHHRGVADVVFRVIIGHAIAIIAFAHYLFLSHPRRSRYRLEFIHILLFVFFPFLPIVIQLTNIFRLLKLLVRWPSQGISKSYVVGGLFGMRIDPGPSINGKSEPCHLLDLEPNRVDARPQLRNSASYRIKACVLLLTTFASWLGIRAYYQRLHITFHTATYVGALGLDHRIGWLAINTFVLTMVTIPVHAINIKWENKPKATTYRGLTELEFTIFVAALIQDILGIVTNHPSAFNVMVEPFLIFASMSDIGAFAAVVVFAIVSIGGHLITVRRAIPVVAVLVMMWILLVAISQVVWDVAEFRDVVAGRYQPWNYRYAVRDPHLSELLLGSST